MKRCGSSGSLVEKERTVPDSYPLSLNALLLACNQRTNRDPVVDFSEATVEAALTGLRDHGLAAVVSTTAAACRSTGT